MTAKEASNTKQGTGSRPSQTQLQARPGNSTGKPQGQAQGQGKARGRARHGSASAIEHQRTRRRSMSGTPSNGLIVLLVYMTVQLPMAMMRQSDSDSVTVTGSQCERGTCLGFGVCKSERQDNRIMQTVTIPSCSLLHTMNAVTSCKPISSGRILLPFAASAAATCIKENRVNSQISENSSAN